MQGAERVRPAALVAERAAQRPQRLRQLLLLSCLLRLRLNGLRARPTLKKRCTVSRPRRGLTAPTSACCWRDLDALYEGMLTRDRLVIMFAAAPDAHLTQGQALGSVEARH